MRFGLSRLFSTTNVAALMGGATVGPSPTLRQVATRSAIPQSTSGTIRAIQSRTPHVAVTAITALKIKFGAWSANSNSEAGNADTTFTASIEYPAGTFTQVLWGGSASKTATSGGDTGLSDSVSVNIPQGATFWVRNLANVSSGNIPYGGVNAKWTAAGENAETSTTIGGLTDKTMGGTINAGAAQVIYPLCILGMSTVPAVALIGDSRTFGWYTGTNSNGTQGQAEPLCGNSYGYINIGVPSEQARGFIKRCARRIALVKLACTHVIGSHAINDMASTPPGAGNLTSVETLGNMDTIRRLIGGTRPFFPMTATPSTYGSAGYTTAAGQTADPNVAQVTAYNSAILAGVSGFNTAIDMANALTDPSDRTKWLGQSPQITDDGLHANSNALPYINAVSLPAGFASATGTNLWYVPDNGALVEWFDAADGGTDNGTLSRYGATSTSSSNSVYSATAFNGGPGRTTNGSTQHWTTNAANNDTSGAPAVTMVLMAQIDAIPTSTRKFYTVSTVTGGNVRCGISINSTGFLGLEMRRLDADTAVTATGSYQVTAGQPFLLVAVFDPTTGVANLYVNGSAASVCSASFASTGNFEATNNALITVGRFGASALYTQMTVREWEIYTSTPTDRSKLEGEITWRNGLQSLLPVGHAYKSAAPTA